MLWIGGIEGEPGTGSGELQDLKISGSGVSRSTGSGAAPEEYPALIDEFERRMGVMRRVVSAGEGKRRMAAEAEAAENEHQTEAQPAVLEEDAKPSEVKDDD
jgi:hypothetical protein